MKDEDGLSETKVPVLGDIPLLGWLFKARETKKQKTNLLVFITPKIVRSPEDNATVVNQKINERIDFIQRSFDGRDPHGQYIDEMPRRAMSKPAPVDNNSSSPGPGDAIPQPNQEEPAVETF